MSKKRPGIKRTNKYGPRFPKWAALDMKAFSGLRDDEYYGFTVSKLGKFHYPTFRAIFAARKYLDLLIRDDLVEWVTKRRLITHPTELEITGPNLRELYEYKYRSDRTRAWDLPTRYNEIADYLRSDRSYHAPPSTGYKTRVSRKGMILIGDICKELDMNPRDARGILRDLDLNKPKHGWAWRTRDEADEIKQTLQQSRRKLQS